jgi:GH15 family glucan-1,4-alpha-glucosidase
VRGGRRHFTHSKVMAWIALDRAVRAIERFGLPGPLNRWRSTREEIHADVCRHGFDREVGAFVQSYGSKDLDASLLLLPLVGFLPAHDPRVQGTVRAITERLTVDGFVLRYQTHTGVDGLPPREGAFLPCTLWLADNLAVQGRFAEARELFERALAAQRRRPAGRGIRPALPEAAGQLPPGPLSRRPHQHRP